MKYRLRALCCVLALLCTTWPAFANSQSFDLTGPTLEAVVTRGKTRLPISEVPNLQAGDKVWIQANFPQSQSVRYLMVVVFLRGATNPPPDKWFHRNRTWRRRSSEGLKLTVPKGARQMLVLLAPETGGAYHTLVNAVEHRPGAFVRASQDLNEATLDRARLDTYLAAIRKVNASNPEKLHQVAPMLARSLAIKLNNTCFDAVSDEQAPCLMHNQNSLVLSDSQSESMADVLTSGAMSNLAMQVSATPKAGFGYYSPYIASVMDMARILESFHSPQYQYIPALAMRKGKAMHLMLNTPPSFGKQKSVIVAAMPAIQAPRLPLLHVVPAGHEDCAEKVNLLAPVDGAPLVFATRYAHGMVLRLKTKNGKTVSLPAEADAEKGGFVIDTQGLDAKQFGDRVQARLDGKWGFVPFTGPRFELANAHPQPWLLEPGQTGKLVVGSNEVVRLHAGNAACVESISLRQGQANPVKTKWKQVSARAVEVTLPLEHSQPGQLTLVVHQYGFESPETVTLHSFAKPPHLTGFALRAGDSRGVLKGSRLGEVARLELNGAKFVPAANTNRGDALMMTAANKNYKSLAKGSAEAHVRLNDGRIETVKATIEAPRPEVKLLAKIVERAHGGKSHIQLAGGNELPQTATLRFSIKAVTPKHFSRGEAVEVATADKVFTTTLTIGNGGLTLQDLHTAVATLHPAKAFGESAFGPLRYRVVDKGVAGKWQPLATLVRLPKLKKLKCMDGADKPCSLTGQNLFLVDAVASGPSFQHAVDVPDGFPGETLKVPHPEKSQLYVKLRDDPGAVNIVALKVEQPAMRRGQKAKTAKESTPELVQVRTLPALQTGHSGWLKFPAAALEAQTANTTSTKSKAAATPKTGVILSAGVSGPGSATPMAKSIKSTETSAGNSKKAGSKPAGAENAKSVAVKPEQKGGSSGN